MYKETLVGRYQVRSVERCHRTFKPYKFEALIKLPAGEGTSGLLSGPRLRLRQSGVSSAVV